MGGAGEDKARELAEKMLSAPYSIGNATVTSYLAYTSRIHAMDAMAAIP